MHQRFISSTEKQISCFKPIKTSFLAAVIAPVPFLFLLKILFQLYTSYT